MGSVWKRCPWHVAGCVEVSSVPELPRDRPAKSLVPTDRPWPGVESASHSGLPGMGRSGAGQLLEVVSGSQAAGRALVSAPSLCLQLLSEAPPMLALGLGFPGSQAPALPLSNHRPNFSTHSALVSPSPPTPEVTSGLGFCQRWREVCLGSWERPCVRPWQHLCLLHRGSWSPCLMSELTDLLRKRGNNPPQAEEKTHPAEPPVSRPS